MKIIECIAKFSIQAMFYFYFQFSSGLFFFFFPICNSIKWPGINSKFNNNVFTISFGDFIITKVFEKAIFFWIFGNKSVEKNILLPVSYLHQAGVSNTFMNDFKWICNGITNSFKEYFPNTKKWTWLLILKNVVAAICCHRNLLTFISHAVCYGLFFIFGLKISMSLAFQSYVYT